MPLNREERAEIAGDIPYWGANGIVDYVATSLFNEELVLIGEDGAPFDDPLATVAFRVNEPVWVNNHIHVLRPRSGHDAQYLTYALNAVDWMPLVSGATRLKLTQDDLMRASVPSWPPAEQRAIAGFLDAETARIDALMVKKRRMRGVLDERFWTWVAARISGKECAFVPLRRVIERICDGPFGSSLTSSHYADDGARVVRLGNVGFAEFKDEDEAFIPQEHYEALSRHRVDEGNLIMAGLGDARNHVGRACVAPDLGPAIVKADCYCVDVNETRAVADFLALFLSSPVGAQRVALAARGTTRSRINLDIAKDVGVPNLPVAEQQIIVREASQLRASTRRVDARLTKQIELLQEHRQALITAAVTGQLDVAGGVAA